MWNEILELWQQYFQGDVDWKQVILIGCTPLFFIGFAIELNIRKRKGAGHPMWSQFNGREIFSNLSLGGAYQLFELIAHALFVGTAIAWFYQQRFFDIPVNGWTIVPIFVAMEFCYYWFHRTSHRVRWFWSAHVVHHSSEEMNMTTAMRQSLLYSITGWWLFFMPLVVLGVNPAVVFALYACNLAYQFFIHTESVDKLHPALEFLLDTPSNHRVHHGRNPEYIDKNYGGVLIIFDRMFGTYAEEVAPVEYGIVEQVKSKNIITLNFHEFIDMWVDAAKAGGLLAGLKHIVKPPEWNRTSAAFTQSKSLEEVPAEVAAEG
ncbi:MAG: sterol desaturase/sphingolipid hydroxylase (fatty acid hydroxylase superfamily) [Pseudoalteromonas tetraodonis]|jgi:sterol desaturase/sphingolipid hydroxylase (fatty acid hydroxylase superfamily)